MSRMDRVAVTEVGGEVGGGAVSTEVEQAFKNLKGGEGGLGPAALKQCKRRHECCCEFAGEKS